jgi:hypothetical protein
MLRTTPEGLVVSLRIIPNSSKNDIVVENEFIKVKVTAQPVENKANKALIEFLSKFLKIPKSRIEILRGDTSKDKVLLFKIDDNKSQEVIQRLTN